VKRWPNGDRYEGGFVDDQKEGRGTYVWGRGAWRGERYEGEYANWGPAPGPEAITSTWTRF
jgi:hypothetical protein